MTASFTSSTKQNKMSSADRQRQAMMSRQWCLRSAVAPAWGHAPLLLSISSLLWSGNFIVARAVHGIISPLDLSFCRWFAALAVVAVPARHHLRQDLGQLRSHWRILLVLAAVGITAMNTIIYRGLQSTTALNALLLQSVAPLIVLVCALALYGDQPRPRQVVAIFFSLLGVAIVAVHGDPVTAWHSFGMGSGDVWIVAGVICYALYTTLLRLRPAVHAMSLLAACFAIGLLLLLPFVLWEHFSGGAGAVPTVHVLPAVAYMALFPSILAFLCFNRGVELIGASRAGHYLHLMPVFGSLLAMTFLGERLHPYHVAGASLIAGGLLLANHTFSTGHSARSGPSKLVRMWQRWRFCSRRARQRQELRHCNARTLHDLGPSRVSCEADKPFWQD